jgi:hypothetical protein
MDVSGLILYRWEKSIQYSMESWLDRAQSKSESGGKVRNSCDVSTALTVKYHILVCDTLYAGRSLSTVWRNALLPSSHRTVSWAEWIDTYHASLIHAACSADVSVMIYQTTQVTFQMTVIFREIPALLGDWIQSSRLCTVTLLTGPPQTSNTNSEILFTDYTIHHLKS